MLEVQITGGTLTMSLIFYALTAATIIGVLIVLYLSLRGSKKNVSLLDDLILGVRQQNRDGYTSVTDKSRFVGKIGVCVTDLRPAGTVSVENEPLDVVAEGNFIKSGTKVKIVNVDGSRVLVRQI